MPSVIYHSAIRDLFTGAIDADTDTFRAMLVTSAYTPNKDTHDRRNDVTGGAPATANAGGAVAAVSVSVDAANDRIEITSAGSPGQDSRHRAAWSTTRAAAVRPRSTSSSPTSTSARTWFGERHLRGEVSTLSVQN